MRRGDAMAYELQSGIARGQDRSRQAFSLPRQDAGPEPRFPAGWSFLLLGAISLSLWMLIGSLLHWLF